MLFLWEFKNTAVVRARIYILLFFLLLALPSVTDGFAVSAQRRDAQHENMVMAASGLYADARYDDALAVLRKVLEEDASNDAAHYYSGLSYLAKGDSDAAELFLKRAADLDSANFWYRQRLAELYSMTSRKELTISVYENLLRDFPKKSDLYFSLVELYASQGDEEKALDTLDEIETIFGMSESVAVFRFNLLQRLDRQEEAFRSLEEYNRQYSSPYVLSTLADWQMSMYNDSTALAYYNEALDLAPDYAPALLGKAETLRMTRRYDEYFPVLEKFVSDKNSPARGKGDYLMALVQRSDPKFLRSFRPRLDTVISICRQVHPRDSNILQTAGIYYYSTSRTDMAGECFRTNALNWPESIGASAGYVEFLMYAQKWDELSRAGREAFGRFPEETAFLEMAGVGDFNLQEYDKVLGVCRQILEVAPRDSSKTLRAWSTMGDIHYRKGESKKAYKAYDRALKINPDYVYVLNNYAYYLSMEGRNLKKACSMSRRTIEAEPDNATYLDTYGWILFLQGKASEAKPIFKHAMLYGGKESAVIMDHYAEVLYALGEYDLAFVYWNLAKQKDKDGELKNLDEKVRKRKEEMK